MSVKKMNTVSIHDTEVNLDAKALKDSKSVGDLKKQEIFSHLDEDDQEKAYKELGKKLKVSSTSEETTVGETLP